MKKAIILAAGKGTRMKSELPKVAHEVCGVPMINMVIDSTKKAGIDENIVIVGYAHEKVKEVITSTNVKYELQKQQLGTGHAVMMAKEHINDDDTIILLNGDMPLVRPETLKEILDYNKETGADITVLTSIYDVEVPYGRIIKDENGNVKCIREVKDATEEERQIREMNVGPEVFRGSLLKDALGKLTNDNAQNEYYVTDIIKIAYSEGKKINTYVLKDAREGYGINSPEDLKKVEEVYKELNK